MSDTQVLVVDDEHSVRHVLSTYLTKRGYQVQTADSAESALEQLDQTPTPDVALVDIVLPGKNGLQLMSEIHQRHPETQVILITSQASVETAIGAIRRGAYDYLQKPFNSLEHMASVVQGAIETKRLSTEFHSLVDRQKSLARELAEAATGMGDADDDRS